MTYIKKYIGDRSFYQTTFYIALPLALQMLLQSCMSIIDTMMVSSIGMVTAVGNASQILMLHDGISWGTISGIAMFASQFFGAKQKDNLGKCFVLSLVIGISNALFWMIMTGFFGGQIMYFYLQDVEVLYYSQLYMQVMVFYLLPYAINNSFMTLYRSTHQTKITLYFSIVGAIANVCLNGFFIFGLNLGVVGAAYGSVIAQVIVLGCNVVYAIKTKQAFIENFAHHFKLDLKFVKPIVYKMLPLIINETLFGFGMTLFVKAFGLLGTDSMSAYYVANQIFQLFLFAVNGYGSAVTILVGTRLGEGRIELAKTESNYQLGLGFVLGVVMVIIMNLCATPLVSLFGYSEGLIYDLAVGMLYVLSLKVFLRMFNFMMFSTLRAGGDAKALNLLDSGIMYMVGLPLAFGSVYAGISSIVIVLLICQIEQVVRLVLTGIRYKQGYWAKDLTKLVA